MTADPRGHLWARIETRDGALLRRPRASDAAGVFAVHGDAEVYTYDPHERHPDVDHSAGFLEPLIAHWDEFGFGYWSVLEQGARGGTARGAGSGRDRAHPTCERRRPACGRELGFRG